MAMYIKKEVLVEATQYCGVSYFMPPWVLDASNIESRAGKLWGTTNIGNLRELDKGDYLLKLEGTDEVIIMEKSLFESKYTSWE